MGAAFVAPRQALVDAIAVGLVGDDEDAAVGQRGGRGEKERGGKIVLKWIAWLHRVAKGNRCVSDYAQTLNND